MFLVKRIWSFGPSRARFNVLFNGIPNYERSILHGCKFIVYYFQFLFKGSNTKFRQLDRAIIAGFDLAMSQGPLCDEPMQGVGIIVEDWQSTPDPEEHEAGAKATIQDPQIYGQLISAMKQSCKVALKKHPLRLVAAMYKVNF